MIQRVQTIYLFLIALISGGLVFVCSLWTLNDGTEEFIPNLFFKSGIFLKSIPTLFLISSVISLIAIFTFKNRKLQFVLGRIIMLIHLFLLGLLVSFSLTLSGEAVVSEKGIGMFLPILVILLAVAANRAIKKDEDLVKSADRLR
ncbi:MAG: DUF4293 family protein [Flavobacteriaceae bacterium]|nr:MAG: DUF4293 family protein [Flavobacteriaceae bacterium]